MAPQLSLLFLRLNSLAQTLATNSTLDDTGHIPPTPPLSDYFIPMIKTIFIMMFSMPSLALILRRLRMGSDGVSPDVLKKCASKLFFLPGQSFSFVSLYF